MFARTLAWTGWAPALLLLVTITRTARSEDAAKAKPPAEDAPPECAANIRKTLDDEAFCTCVDKAAAAAAAKKKAEEEKAAKAATEAKEAAQNAAKAAAAVSPDQNTKAATEAKEAAQSAAKAAAALATDLNALKAGKLIQFGVTGGLAFSVQTPWGSSKVATQRTVEVTSMPYVLFVPGYWLASGPSKAARRAYCAADWDGGDSWESALSVGRKQATQLYEKIAADVQARTVGGEQLAPKDICNIVKGDFVDREPEDEHFADYDIGLPVVQAVIKKSRDAAIDELTYNWYSPDSVDGSCWGYKLGIWVGRPSAYTATTKLDELDKQDVRRSRDVKPVIAFGASFVPNAYISLLFGVTIGKLQQQDIPADAMTMTPLQSGTDHTVWTGTVALGGNLDVLGSLAK